MTQGAFAAPFIFNTIQNSCCTQGGNVYNEASTRETLERKKVMKCHCCNKSIKTGYKYEGNIYGLICLCELISCTTKTAKKVAEEIKEGATK